MNRQETIKTLQQIAADIAQEMGYTEMRVGEDRQKGIWGESFGLSQMRRKTWHSVTTSNFHSVSATHRSVLTTGKQMEALQMLNFLTGIQRFTTNTRKRNPSWKNSLEES